jgi:hypothetical protein
MHSCFPITKLPSEEEDVCPLCFDAMAPDARRGEDTIQLQCGHKLHTQCLADMLGSGVAAGRRWGLHSSTSQLNLRRCVTHIVP